MKESEIKNKFKEKDSNLTEKELNEIYQILLENNEVPKDIQDLEKLFEELEERNKFIIWDDSDDLIDN